MLIVGLTGVMTIPTSGFLFTVSPANRTGQVAGRAVGISPGCRQLLGTSDQNRRVRRRDGQGGERAWRCATA